MLFNRQFLFSATVVLTIIAMLYAAAFNYQFGAPLEASYDVNNWRWFKEYRAEQTKGPQRLLLLGDSNVLFGMDSRYAEQELGMPVVNMGLHGGQPLDWILSVALRQARSGDIVVLPLTFGYYVNDYRKPNDWNVKQIVAWDRPYFDQLSLLRKLRYVAAISPSTLYDNVKAKEGRESILKNHPSRRLLSPEEALAHYNAVAHLQSAFSYGFVNMNSYGDMQHTCLTDKKTVRKAGYGVPINQIAPVNSASLSLLLETIETLRDRGVKVFVTAPVQLDDDTTRSPTYQATILDIWKTLRHNAVPVLGNPTDYFFPLDAFFDTDSHLNCDYSIERTKTLVAALKAKF